MKSLISSLIHTLHSSVTDKMITQFSEVCIGNSIVINGLAGVKVSSRTADFIVGEIDGVSQWKKMFVKQKENVRIADPGTGIVLTF